MSYEKLKSIKIDKENKTVSFLNKSNNNTSPFRKNKSNIPDFLHNCWGGVYQHENNKINDIVLKMKKKFEAVSANENLWFDFDSIYSNPKTQEELNIVQIFNQSCEELLTIN